jgi:hypothetical protein
VAHILDADDIEAKAIDNLAEDLAKLTGETKAQATAKALADRLARERKAKEEAAQIMAAAADLRARYPIGAVSKADMDSAWGE